LTRLDLTYRVNGHNENMTKPFDYLVHKHGVRTFYLDDTDFINMVLGLFILTTLTLSMTCILAFEE